MIETTAEQSCKTEALIHRRIPINDSWSTRLHIRKIIILTFYFLILTFQGFAQILDTTKVYDIGEVAVIGKRISAETIPVQTLSGKTLSKLNTHSVADALRYFSGVQLKDYGGVGGLKTVNIRSMGSQHIGVFYDGVEIGNPQNGVVDLGRYSLDNMDAISLYNGQKSAIFQSARDYASASSIYMMTKTPMFDSKNYNVRATLKTGSFDLVNPSVVWEQKLSDKVRSSFNAEYIYSSGKYKFRHKVDNPHDNRGGYDTTEVRRNGDIHSLRIEQAFMGNTNGGDWKTRIYFYDSERGYPGADVKEPGNYAHEDRQWDTNFFVQFSRKKAFKSYSSLLSGKYAYDYIYYKSDTLLQRLRNKYHIHEFYLSSANIFTILPFWSANISADAMYNKMNSDMAGFIYPQRYSGWIAVASSLQLEHFKLQVSLLTTIIHEETKEETSVKHNRSKLTPTIVASWQPYENHDFFLRFFYKDIFRMPTFSEMHLAYMGSLSSFLKPEYARQYNMGTTYSKQIGTLNISAQVDGYYNRITNKLMAVPGGVNFRWTMKNIGLVKIKGVDAVLSGQKEIGKYLSLSTRVNYTWQKAQDYSNPLEPLTYKGQIAYIPWHSGSLVAGVEYRTWQLNYSFIYTGERYTVSANIPENKVQEWYTHDLSVNKNFDWKQNTFSLTAELNNFMNQQYDVVKNYPMPGTNIRLILKMTI